MATRLVKASTNIQPYARNAKKHPDVQLKQIALSLKEYGWRQPIVLDKQGTIIVGHGRWLAYQTYPDGIGKPWIVTADDLTPEQVRGYRLMDNKTNESDWDMALAIEELKELDALGFDIELTGFDKDLLIEPDDKDDIVPTDAPTRAKTGDLWALGEHRILCGDSTKAEDVERLMGGKKADMVFTDPPYGMFLDADFSGMKSDLSSDFGKRKMVGHKYDDVIGDHEEFDPAPFIELFGYCKEQFWWGGDYYAERIPLKNEGSFVCWDKMNGGEGVNDKYDKMFGSNFELCWSRQKHKRALVRVLWKGIFGMGKGDEKKRIHPTQKPVELVTWFFTHFSAEESLVVDLFLGSGSTLIAAEKTGRICYGMEISPAYVDVVLKRWEDYTGKTAILQE